MAGADEPSRRRPLAAADGAVVALPALEQAATKATARMRPAKAPVRVRLFTCLSWLLVGPSWWPARWLGGPPGARCPDDVVL